LGGKFFRYEKIIKGSKCVQRIGKSLEDVRSCGVYIIIKNQERTSGIKRRGVGVILAGEWGAGNLATVKVEKNSLGEKIS